MKFALFVIYLTLYCILKGVFQAKHSKGNQLCLLF
jgi:hypothetical protein